ncbi:MAG: DNA mismatch repair endonuclease MutL [Deltaproteobacteria bacterium]|nr:DNA mismatch repair endonuclease MutL [Deltaproteobacteria bacterium]
MAQKINILDPMLAGKIAAGEVVERPASVVKELIENSIDAGAKNVSVWLAEGGRRQIKVVDDGGGMCRQDALIAFMRHSTSKVASEEDLSRITSYGFRGEALASIAAVAKVCLRTRERDALSGTKVAIGGEGGAEPLAADDGCPEGASIEVKDLFYSTPARFKFMRSAENEYGRTLEVLRRIALSNPDVSFTLFHGSTKSIDTKAGTLRDRIFDLFGDEVLKNIIEVNSPLVTGFIGSHEQSYATLKGVNTFVNGRWIRDKGITRAVIDGYGTILETSRFPFAVLDIRISPEDVDVNIHPAKSEVRFKSPGFVYDIVKAAVRGALGMGAAPAAFPYAPIGRMSGWTQAAGAHAGERPAAYGGLREAEDGLPFFNEAASGGAQEVKNPEFLGLRAVGQLWAEFLIAESPSGANAFFYVIDQHGAEERSAFERLKRAVCGGAALNRQMLLVPERIETTPEEKDALSAAMEHLGRFGFELTPFGPSIKEGGETFLIRSVPDMLASRSCANLLKDIAEELSDESASSRLEDRIEAALMRIACHSVIRGARPLEQAEADALVGKLAYIDFAGFCPHGRPVVKKFLRKEIEAVFKR